MRARSPWALLPVFWGITLAGALLGGVVSRVFLEHRPAAALGSNLPWALGGSLWVAAVATVGELRRRRRGGEPAGAAGRLGKNSG